MLPKIIFVRMERETTGSWITYRLDRPTDDPEKYCAKVMPAWECVSGAPDDPDDILEPWRNLTWDGRTWD